MAVLKWIGLLLLGLVVVGLALFTWVDMRGFAARQASAALGREVAIDGPLTVTLGDPIHVHSEGVRVANPEWATEKSFATLKALDADLRLWPLLRGVLDIPTLQLTQPVLDLEKNERGENNWSFPPDPRKEAVKKAVEPDTRHEIPIIERLLITDGRVRYRDPVQAIDVDSTMSSVTAQPERDQVALNGQGRFAGKDLTMQAKGGGLSFLRNSTEPYPVLIEATVGKTSATVEGSIKDPVSLDGVDLSVTLRGDDMAEIFPIFGIPTPKTRPYSLSSHLGRNGAVWNFEGMQGKVGESDLDGSVAVDLSGERPRVTGDLSSKRLAALDLVGFTGASPRGREDYPTKGRGRILPATTIDLGMLRAADMDVHFHGQRVEAPFAPLDSLDARIRLDDGLLHLEPLTLGVGGGQIGGVVLLDSRERKTPTLKATLKITHVTLTELFRGTQFAKDMGGTLTGHVELAGSGPTMADILAVANGKIGVVIDGGRLSSLAVKGLKTNLLETLGVVVAGSQPLPFNCFVTDMTIEKGMLKTKALVLDTPETLVIGSGGISLKDERLDLLIEGHSKQPQLFATHVPVMVRGSFRDPDISLDPSESAARGAAAVALGVLLTPLASLLALADTGASEQPHCQKLVRDAQKTGGGRQK